MILEFKRDNVEKDLCQVVIKTYYILISLMRGSVCIAICPFFAIPLKTEFLNHFCGFNAGGVRQKIESISIGNDQSETCAT